MASHLIPHARQRSHAPSTTSHSLTTRISFPVFGALGIKVNQLFARSICRSEHDETATLVFSSIRHSADNEQPYPALSVNTLTSFESSTSSTASSTSFGPGML
eukprot:m.76108 g.76108  ORF g.76108 m.76108 type:complete len:103 (+) comp10488_c1_seq1:94-402(+)